MTDYGFGRIKKTQPAFKVDRMDGYRRAKARAAGNEPRFGAGAKDLDAQSQAGQRKAARTAKAARPSVPMTVHKNAQAGNPRSGQMFRTVQAKGGVYHVYSSGERVFVRKPQSDTNRRYF